MSAKMLNFRSVCKYVYVLLLHILLIYKYIYFQKISFTTQVNINIRYVQFCL